VDEFAKTGSAFTRQDKFKKSQKNDLKKKSKDKIYYGHEKREKKG
jgi:hypothetical protein